METATTQSIGLQQTLHGYSDGHRLLTASFVPTRRDKALMLALSDMSGPSMVTGFEQYYSGYPLTDAGLYAFASTWYAPEMPRPGCVWTHTLLIPFADIGSIPGLRALLQLFRHPSPKTDLSVYSKAIDVSLAEMRHADWTKELVSDMSPASGLIQIFLGSDGPFIVAVDAGEGFERELMNDFANESLDISKWLWPELRRRFTFCTGAISPRRLDGVDFDLQIIPPKHRSRFSKIERATIVGDVQLTLLPANGIPPWGEFREFVLRWGPDTPSNRQSALVLADLWRNLRGLEKGELSGLRSAVSAVEHGFEASVDAAELKRSLVTDILPEYTSRHFAYSKSEIVNALIPLPRGFEPVLELIKGLASQAWEKECRNARAVLHSNLKVYASSEEVSAQECLKGIAAALDPDELSALREISFGAVLQLVRYRPQLLESKELWDGDGQFLEELVPVLDELIASSNVTLGVTLSAALAANNTAAAEYFVEKNPAACIPAVLDWVEENPSADPRRVQAVLANHGDLTLVWFSSHPKAGHITAALVLRANRYDVGRLRNGNLTRWLPLAGAAKLWDQDSLQRSKVALLELGLLTKQPVGALLVRETFREVHGALVIDVLPWGYWEVLRAVLPEIAYGHRWDKAEQLRQGMIDAFINYQWPLEEFAAVVAGDDIWKYIVRSESLRHRHRKFLSHFWDRLVKNTLTLTEEVRRKFREVD